MEGGVSGYRLVVIGSTGGGVFSTIAKHSFIKEMIFEAVSDRECGFISTAERYGLPSRKIESRDGASFSNELLKRFGDAKDLIFLSFYTRLFKGSFVSHNMGRIFNCHPSILPSFKGMRGFEDTVNYGSRFMGCTLHQVDEGMDTGCPIIQAAIPFDPELPLSENRHKVFLAQSYTTIQFLRWVYDGRFTILPSGGFSLSGVNYKPSIFSPNLDGDFFHFISEVNGIK